MQAILADDTLKATTLIRITAVAWFFAKIMSWKLWLADRIFPIVAPIDCLDTISSHWHLSLMLLSFCFLFIVVIYPEKKIFIGCLLGAELLSCALDQLRWQPWEYQYLLTIFFFLLFKTDKSFIKSLSLLLIATYIFSGLFKCNEGFLHSIWDNMILRKLFGFSDEIIGNSILHFSGFLLPMIEIVSGLGLLFAKNKKPFVWLTVATHLFLLLALGPVGLHRNSIVWPWNVAMMLLVFTMFYKRENPIITSDFFKNKANVLVVLIVAILPLTNFIGFWPSYLSFKLYSGNTERLAICIENTDQNPELQQFVVKNKSKYCLKLQSINASKWALTELNVVIYPEEAYYKKLKKSWIRKFPKTPCHFMIFRLPSKPENMKEIP